MEECIGNYTRGRTAGQTRHICRYSQHPDQKPSPANTYIFSLIIYASYCEYRFHWRRVDGDGTISYQGDIITTAFLDEEDEIFKTRGSMLKTLDWARRSRLTAVQAALHALESGPAVQETRYAQLSMITLISLILVRSPPQTDAARTNAPHATNL